MSENDFKKFFSKEKFISKKFEINLQDSFDIIDIKTKIENEKFYLNKNKRTIRIITDNVIILKMRTVDKNTNLIIEREKILNTFDTLLYDKIEYFEQLNEINRFKFLNLIIKEKNSTFYLNDKIVYLEVFYTIKLHF